MGGFEIFMNPLFNHRLRPINVYFVNGFMPWSSIIYARFLAQFELLMLILKCITGFFVSVKPSNETPLCVHFPEVFFTQPYKFIFSW